MGSTFGRKAAKKITVSHKMAGILTISRKRHHPFIKHSIDQIRSKGVLES